MGDPFFVQDAPKEQWHVESEDDCEVMLCGKVISVDLSTVRVQHRWGPRKCPGCWMVMEKRRRLAAFGR